MITALFSFLIVLAVAFLVYVFRQAARHAAEYAVSVQEDAASNGTTSEGRSIRVDQQLGSLARRVETIEKRLAKTERTSDGLVDKLRMLETERSDEEAALRIIGASAQIPASIAREHHTEGSASDVYSFDSQLSNAQLTA
jgi:cbb3-type cytochrome oxidase subunit 3